MYSYFDAQIIVDPSSPRDAASKAEAAAEEEGREAFTFDASKPHIFIFSPHGVFGWSSILFLLSFQRGFRPFSGLRIRALAAAVLLSIPLVREIMLYIGYIDASKKVAVKFLRRGFSLLIYVGGSLEVLECDRFGKDVNLIIERRKGFVRMALEEGGKLRGGHRHENFLSISLAR